MKKVKYKSSIAILLLLVVISVGFDVTNSWGTTVEELAKTVVFLRYKFQVYETVDGKKVEVWYKLDPKKEEYEPKLGQKVGTGFVVKHNNQLYIVTAKHVADFLGDKAEVVMNLTPHKSMSMTFEALDKCPLIPGAKWFFDKSADVAIHPLCPPQPHMDQLSIPDTLILKDESEIPLLSTVYVVGFPLGLGTHHFLSPIAKKVQIASAPLSLTENKSALKLLLLDQALAQGYSGAPVFLIKDVMAKGFELGGKPFLKTGEQIYLAGLVSAQISDKLGGKISVIVPASYIWNVFLSPNFISYENNLKEK